MAERRSFYEDRTGSASQSDYTYGNSTYSVPLLSPESDGIYSVPDSTFTPKQTQAVFWEYLKMLGLTSRFPRKLSIHNAMIIRKETLGNVVSTDQIKKLPFLILHKIMMFDARSRASLYTGEIPSNPVLENIDEIHPLDIFLILLHCCNNFLTQDVLTRLSTCQLAIPFLLPSPYDGSIMYLLWGMREIIRAWKSTNSNGKLASNECRIVDYPAPIISFYKIGELQQSKSKIINEVISESRVDFFFNWDCEGGTSDKQFVDGMAELCCYLPSGKKDVNDFYSDILMFTNLRGDARKHSKQLHFMQKISYMSCVLLQESDLDDEAFGLLEILAQCPGGVIVMFADLKNSQKFKYEKLNHQLHGMCVIKLKGKNYAQIRNEVRKEIVSKLSTSTKAHYKKLNECVDIAKSFEIQIDEDDKGCKEGRNLAEGVMQLITSLPAHEAKLRTLPLQGPDLWHKWATLDKESYRQLARNKSFDIYSKDMEIKKKAVRQNQLNFTVKPTTVMKAFLSNLVCHDGIVRFYFLHWLKMLLDDHSRKVLPSLNNAYQKTRADLLKAKAENKSEHEDSDIIIQLKENLKEQNEQLVNASFGLEHFFREMGQMYEARMDVTLKRVSRDLQDEVSIFPQIMADLMSEGYPVELMDGDAAHVPITWVLAVIGKLKEMNTDKQRIFVISVLGIQSTGKSTLLNTIFGLRFNVSAGRCTRGAYFQLLPFNTELRKEIGCDHILIVDTEGLRAPELQYKEQQKHDNELATFVIGLADLTIINIYGETPGELTDILQTAVHAFIRMKNVEMQLSCHFVHQNVTAVMADSKSKVGRQNFQDRLDFMTSTAAKLEKCEGRFRSFQDVIQFNDETNVTLFPSLWKGDPPMAPVNPGYSFKASTLKESIITSVQGKENQFKFAEFKIRVNKLWLAVLQEKFVFSFKNTLEVTAYNELDTKYSQWSWDLQHKMLEWQHQAGNQISSCDISDIDSMVDNCLLEIEKDLSSLYLKLNDELVEFFEKSERSETLSQWRTSTEVRLKNLCEEHKDEARKYCSMLRQTREGRVKIDSIQQTYRQQLKAQIIGLASDTKNLALTDAEREDIFNTQWQQWIKGLLQNNKPVAYATAEHMEMQIGRMLEKNYTSHSHLVVEGLNAKALSKRGTLQLKITHLHLDSTKLLKRMTKQAKNMGRTLIGANEFDHYAGVSSEDVRLAEAQTEIFFHQIEESMGDKMERCQDFNKSLISSLLMELQRLIDKFNDGKNNFRFTPHYQVDIAIIVSGYAYQKFIAKVQQLAFENDPVEAMNRLKPLFFRTFETQFSEASNDQTAVQNLCNILTKSIEKALTEKLQIQIVYSMKLESIHFRKKNYFKVLVMKDLAAAKDFNLFKEYLRNIGASLKYWSKIYVRRYCEKRKDNKTTNTNLFDLAVENLNVIVSAITKVIKETGEGFDIADTASIVSDEDSIPLEDYNQHLNVKEWLESFHENVKKTITIDLQEIMDVIGVDSIHNPSFFTQQLIKNLKAESEMILADYKNTQKSIANLTTESAKSPHMVLYSSLIGCKEQCPFCGEQCELTDENHLDLKKPHYTEIHRPKCLGGYTYVKDNKLVFDTCTVAIESDASFSNADTNQEKHPYKEYKKIYPKWQISTESPKTGPKYWEWFIAKYLSELTEWNEADPTSLQDQGWEDITEEDALDNLTETYGLNIDPA